MKRGIPLTLIPALLILACGTPGREVPATVATAQPIGGDTLRAELTLRNNYFEPSRLVTEVGRPLRLVLIKRSGFLGIVPHDFNLIAPETGINVSDQPVSGDGDSITITPTKAGEYRFFCGKGDHAAEGMEGRLIVKEDL